MKTYFEKENVTIIKYSLSTPFTRLKGWKWWSLVGYNFSKETPLDFGIVEGDSVFFFLGEKVSFVETPEGS